VSWAQRTPKKLSLEPTSEQLQRCGCPYVLRQAVPNSGCGSSKDPLCRVVSQIPLQRLVANLLVTRRTYFDMLR